MISCLYLVTICFCLGSKMTGEYVIIPILLGIAFFWIATICYDRTITKLKDEIIELNKKIDNLKELFYKEKGN